MPVGELNPDGWKQLTDRYPDQTVTATILGICYFGARIGYEGERIKPTIHRNLKTAEDDSAVVAAELASEQNRGRLKLYAASEVLPDHYTASPLGLTDKLDGSKRRIHHLSYPPTCTTFINAGIPENYGTIEYSAVDDAIQDIQAYGNGCKLIKGDFESAFRHIPVSPLDAPLLGFHWESRFCEELVLPFGLRTAPHIFNLFTEVFHWILEDQFSRATLTAKVIHYLDDFLIVIPATENTDPYSRIFSHVYDNVGLAIKTAKNEQGCVATFGGVELDTKSMVVRLPTPKLAKARSIIQTALAMTSMSLLDIQKITGYFNFATIVVPLGRAFLRRLYNMALYFPERRRNRRRRVSRQAQKNLMWWSTMLSHSPERSISNSGRDIVSVWTDVASTKGLGAFFLRSGERSPHSGSAFSIHLPRHLMRAREHINTQEMRAVEQALLYWGKDWSGKKVILNIDNRAVAYGISNRTIRGAPMTVLRRCLMLVAQFDLDLEVQWIPTKD